MYKVNNKECSKLHFNKYSIVPIKRTVFLLTVYGMKNTVRLIGTLEYNPNVSE
jgi:hypothetical protein